MPPPKVTTPKKNAPATSARNVAAAKTAAAPKTIALKIATLALATPAIGPRARAAVARNRNSSLSDDEIVFVDRLGPRILHLPAIKSVVPLDREVLRNLVKGISTGALARGSKFSASRMMANSELVVESNGHYTIKRKVKSGVGEVSDAMKFETLNLWTGEKETIHADRDMRDLLFYSVHEEELPSYHSWRGETLFRREESVELENKAHKQELAENPKKPALLPTGDWVDQFHKNYYAKLDEELASNPEALLRHKPEITPADPEWQMVEEFFKWIFEEERKRKSGPRVYQILMAEFVESQRLLVIPAANSSYRAKIQEENSKLYEEALKTKFVGKKNDLITKLTMLAFGLPVAPLTLTNIEHAGSAKDNPGAVPGDKTETISHSVEQIMWSEKPLEFLDSYHQRSYGYPTLRTRKRKHDGPQLEISQKDIKIAKKHYAALKKEGWGPFGRPGCGFRPSKPRRFGKSKLSLRGGAGDPASLNPTKLVWIWNVMGHFQLSHRFLEFKELIERLVRWPDAGEFEIDLIPTGLNADLHKLKTISIREAPDQKLDLKIFKEHISRCLLSKDWQVRVRQGGRSHDPFKPASDAPHIVELQRRDSPSIAYWHLPIDLTKVSGINQRQDTFRNAIECLFEHHWKYVVDYQINTSGPSGYINLSAGPSEEFWRRILDATASGQRVKIWFKDLKHKGLKLIVPGSSTMFKMNERIVGEDQAKEDFSAIRAAINQHTAPFPPPSIRVWAGISNYGLQCDYLGHDVHAILDTEPEEQDPNPDEQDAKFGAKDSQVAIQLNLLYEEGELVARPEYDSMKVCDSLNLENEVQWDINDGDWSLASFRNALSNLWPDYTRTDYFIITAVSKDGYFVIGPEMTELQWRLQVLDWIESDQIMVQANLGNGLEYVHKRLLGPLGPTYSIGEKVVEPVRPVTKPQYKAIGQFVSPTDKILSEPVDVTASEPEISDTQNWEKYVLKQATEHLLRQEAYIASPTIFGSKPTPQISIYGQPQEESLSSAPGLPKTFVNPATATEVDRYVKEFRTLQNAVLERAIICPMCSQGLPSGPNSSEALYEHFTQHSLALKSTVDNAFQTTHPHEEGFYCEVCGKSSAEVETEYPGDGAKHAEQCADVSEFHSAPKFCQYCGLDLWTTGLHDEDIETHISNCAALRFVHTPQGQIRLYQDLLQSATGQSNRPPGEFMCHFQGCDVQFSTADTNTVKAAHLANHVRYNHQEKNPLQMVVQHSSSDSNEKCPQCGKDLADLSQARIDAHTATHQEIVCHFPGCELNMTAFAQKDVIAHMQTHLPATCPFPDCGLDMSQSSQKERKAHAQRHKPITCPISGCGMNIKSLSAADRAAQEQIHERSVTCPIELCGADLSSLSQSRIADHMNIHAQVNCPVSGCGLAMEGMTDAEIILHLRTHTKGDTTSGPVDKPVVKSTPTSVAEPSTSDAESSPSVVGPSTPAAGPSTGGQPQYNEEELDDVPESLKKAHPGMGFYCPSCLNLVSGKAAAPCRRHRYAPCNVHGNHNWLLYTRKTIVEARKEMRAAIALKAAAILALEEGDAGPSQPPKVSKAPVISPKPAPKKGGKKKPGPKSQKGKDKADDDDDESAKMPANTIMADYSSGDDICDDCPPISKGSGRTVTKIMEPQMNKNPWTRPMTENGKRPSEDEDEDEDEQVVKPVKKKMKKIKKMKKVKR